VPFKPVSFLTL